ncbi:MAG: TIGR04283 family arsenosugar biosynthesis glycosyltransferase [Acidobacteriota bacterium]
MGSDRRPVRLAACAVPPVKPAGDQDPGALCYPAHRPPMRLSIVLPTLNEEKTLLPSLRQALALSDDVWVSDGGSDDGTVELARREGARVVEGPPGRGGQLNRGAEAASGDVLLFLHADTELPAEALEQIALAIEGGAEAGGFHVRYSGGGHELSELGHRLVRWRTSWSKWPLGDQAQFVTRAAFDAVGGFEEWPILEDLELIRRLGRRGHVRVLEGPVTTSPRRFAAGGTLRTAATNWLIWGLYFLGVAPQRLARFYRHVR